MANDKLDKEELSFDDEEIGRDIDTYPDEKVLIAASRALPGVLLFNDKKYAVGLSWLTSDDDSNIELAKDRAGKMEADFYALRTTVTPQQGFGYLEKGHRMGQQAAAVMAADTLVGEWHGVFAAENGWWYVAVHADTIAPDGDTFFTSEEEAYNHFLQASEGYLWPRAYAPEAWNIPNTSGEVGLAKLLEDNEGPSLNPCSLDAVFSGRRNKYLALVSGLILLGLLVGSVVLNQLVPSLVPSAPQMPLPNIETSENLQTPPKEPVAYQEIVDETFGNIQKPRPSAFVQLCLDGLSGVNVVFPNWQIKSLTCEETMVRGVWGADGDQGSLDSIRPYIDRLPPESAKSFSGSGEFLVTNIIDPKVANEKLSFPDRDYAILLLNSRFGKIGSLAVTELIPPASQDLLTLYDQTLQQQQQGQIAELGETEQMAFVPLTVDDLPYLKMTLETKTPPNLLARYFDMNGMIIRKVAFDTSSRAWTYDASIVVNPDKRIVETYAARKKFAEGQTE